MSKNTFFKFIDRNALPITIYLTAIICIARMPGYSKDLLPLQLGGITLSTTIFWGFLNYQYAHDRLFKDLFKEFNERYDRFNDHYDRISSAYKEDHSQIEPLDRKIIIDYINLCAEEFYWFEKGRLDEQAWSSWEAGMKTWTQLPAVRQVYQEDVGTWETSYYKGFQKFFEKMFST
ncbi:hypothetical protein D3C87_406330 [compost metagenome]